MWWQPSECPEDLATANWNAAFISLIPNCRFCDLDGRKVLNQLTLDCGKVRRSKWPIPLSLLQQKSRQSLCCWLFQLQQRESFSCRSDTALHSHITVSLATCHLSVKHWARELVWPSRDRRGYTSYWRAIPCCTCILAECGLPSLKFDSICLVQRYPISWSFMIPFLWNTKYI